MFAIVGPALSLLSFSEEAYAALPNKMPIITLAEVEQVYKHAESTLAGFPEKA